MRIELNYFIRAPLGKFEWIKSEAVITRATMRVPIIITIIIIIIRIIMEVNKGN